MSEQEEAIWKRFLQNNFPTTAEFFYDVGIGAGPELPPDAPKETRELAQSLGRLRIDAVSKGKEQWRIYEVKHDAGPSAIGQIHSYVFLWQKDPPDTLPVTGIIVTDNTSRDTLNAATAIGVQIYVV